MQQVLSEAQVRHLFGDEIADHLFQTCGAAIARRHLLVRMGEENKFWVYRFDPKLFPEEVTEDGCGMNLLAEMVNSHQLPPDLPPLVLKRALSTFKYVVAKSNAYKRCETGLSLFLGVDVRYEMSVPEEEGESALLFGLEDNKAPEDTVRYNAVLDMMGRLIEKTVMEYVPGFYTQIGVYKVTMGDGQKHDYLAVSYVYSPTMARSDPAIPVH